MENNIVITNKRNKKEKSAMISLIVAIILMLSSVLLYLFGGILYQGKVLNVISAVDYVLKCLNLNEYNVYESISSAFIGLFYLYFVYDHIKHCVDVIRVIKRIRKSREKDFIYNYKLLQKYVNIILSKSVVVLATSYLMASFSLSLLSLLIIIVAILGFLNKVLSIYYLTNSESTLNQILFEIEKISLVLVLLALSIQLIDQHIFDLFNGFTLWSKAIIDFDYTIKQFVYFSYHYILKSVLLLIIAINFLVVLSRILEEYNGDNENTTKYRDKFKALIVVLPIIMLVDCFVENHLFEENIRFTVNILKEWFKVSKSTFITSIMLLAAGLLLFNKQDKVDEKTNNESNNVQPFVRNY